jgi:predicted Ser/Thr protein kinase
VTTSPQTPTDLYVGDYRVLAKIGEGGMGVVHLAQAPDGTRVALKVLRPHVIGDDEARERLAREVESLRRVTSPRVAEVLDADPWGETPFVATRYVPGLSLHQHVRAEGRVRGEDLRHFAAGLAEAVIAVHQVGVLHRDIKPSNVLLEGRSPVLIDFGLARLAEDPRLTHTGWLLGTPGYLAPEILYGEDATTASDVHAWAATVVFAATGRPPFGTGPAMAIMDRVRRGEHDLSGVPESLYPLVLAGLAPEPEDRPTTGAVVAALRGGAPAASTSRAAAAEQPPTMPWMVADHGAAPTTTVGPATPGTKPLTVLAPPVVPARAPFQPPAPAARSSRELRPPSLLPAGAMRQPTGGSARAQRVLLLGGGFTTAAVAFGVAPYLAFCTLAVLALAVRTLSWTTESARERQHLRGRRAWYDAPLTVLSTPWYLVVATGGTLLMLLWSGTLASILGVAGLLFRAPAGALLVATGALFTLGLWTGPGSKRLRLPVRRGVVAVTRDVWIGWTVVAGVSIVLVSLAWLLLSGEPSWSPQPGPPWRDGTLLGSLRAWL